MSLSVVFLFEGELTAMNRALERMLHWKCECGDELQVGGMLGERSTVVREWQKDHSGKGHCIVRMDDSNADRGTRNAERIGA